MCNLNIERETDSETEIHTSINARKKIDWTILMDSCLLQFSFKNVFTDSFYVSTQEDMKRVFKCILSRSQIKERLKQIIGDIRYLRKIIEKDKDTLNTLIEKNDSYHGPKTIKHYIEIIKSVISQPRPFSRKHTSTNYCFDREIVSDITESSFDNNWSISSYKWAKADKKNSGKYYIRHNELYYFIPPNNEFKKNNTPMYSEPIHKDYFDFDEQNLKHFDFAQDLDELGDGFSPEKSGNFVFYVIFSVKSTCNTFLICYAPKVDRWFRRAFDIRFKNRNGLQMVNISYSGDFSYEYSVFIKENKLVFRMFTDEFDTNAGWIAKIGRPATSDEVSNKLSLTDKRPLGIFFYGKCQNDVNNDMGLNRKKTNNFIVKNKKNGYSINEEKVVFSHFNEKVSNEFIKGLYHFDEYRKNLAISKLNSAHVLNLIKDRNEIPFREKLKDYEILKCLEKYLPANRYDLLLELFERFDWRFEDIEPVENPKISGIILDIDSVVCQFSLEPFPELDKKITCEDLIISIIEFIDKEVFNDSKMKSTFLIDLTKTIHKKKGHTYYKDKNKFYELYSNNSILFYSRVRFINLNENVNEVTVIKEAIRKAFFYWSSYKNQKELASSQDGQNKIRIHGCPGFNLIVILLISIEYEIEFCLENYNDKMNINFTADSLENLKLDFNYKTSELKTNVGFSILTFCRKIKKFLQENQKISSISSKLHPKVYVGYGTRVNLTDNYGRKLFSVANLKKNPSAFNQNNGFEYFSNDFYKDKLRFPDADNKGFVSFPILGGLLGDDLLPQSISDKKYFQNEISNEDKIIRIQSYSSTVRYMSERIVNRKSVSNGCIDSKYYLDLEKLRKNYEIFLTELTRNFKQLCIDGSEARMEIAKNISHKIIWTDENIEKILMDDLFNCFELTKKCSKGYSIKNRLDLVEMFMQSIKRKINCTWEKIQKKPVHIDMYPECCDLLSEITSISWTFWDGRYPKTKPYLGDIQTYVGRPILIPLGIEGRESNFQFQAIYKEFLTNLNIDESGYCKPPYTMIVKPPKIKYELEKKLTKENENLSACAHCQLIFSDNKNKDKDKNKHKCSKRNADAEESFIKVTSDEFINIHNTKYNNLSDEQKEAYNTCLKSNYCLIVGQPGSGKTTVLKMILERLVMTLGASKVLGFARDNNNAEKLGGKTFHSLFGFTDKTNFNKAWSEDAISDHINTMQEYKKDLITNLKFLGGDEISQISKEMFEMADKICQIIRNVEDPFGGIKMVIIGDFFQLPPIGDEQKLILQTQLFSESFLRLHLNTMYRTEKAVFQKLLIDVRDQDFLSNQTHDDIITPKFGTNTKLEHALFIYSLLLECLLEDVNNPSKQTKNNIKKYNLNNLIWNNDGKNYVLNLKGIVQGINRLERTCSDGTVISQTNSIFFTNFPITLCVENSEVNFLNEKINSRGADSNIDYRNYEITIEIYEEDSYQYSQTVYRTFYLRQEIIYINRTIENLSCHLGKVLKLDRTEITIRIFASDKIIIINEEDIAKSLYPYKYFRCEPLSEEDRKNDSNIHNFERFGKYISLRKGQR